MPLSEGSFYGVDIQFATDRGPLDLYDPADRNEIEERSDRYIRNHYVRAISGAHFDVRVLITPLFELYDLGDNDVVKLSVRYDGHPRAYFRSITRLELEQGRRHGCSVGCIFESLVEFHPESGHFVEGRTAFWPLRVHGGDEIDVDPYKAQLLGCIQIDVERFRRRRLAVPIVVNYDPYVPVKRISENLLRAQSVADVIRIHGNVTLPTAVPPEFYENFAFQGEAAKKITSLVRYRREPTLQSLGVIPLTPAPVASPSPVVVKRESDHDEKPDPKRFRPFTIASMLNPVVE